MSERCILPVKFNTARFFTLSIIIMNTLLFYGCDIELLGFFYSYSTPDQRFEQSRALRQPSSIIPSGGSYSLAVFSDPHISSDFYIDFNSLIDTLPLNRNDELAAVAVLGDLVQDGCEADFQKYCESTEGLPMLNVIGNHDLYRSGWNHYRTYLGPSSYAVSIGRADEPGSMLVVSLDSANATLGKKQTGWLTELMEKERSSYTYCIVITHSNFFTSTLETRVQFSDKGEVHSLIDLFKTYRVDYMFSGHSHQLYEFKLFNTNYVCLDAVRDPGSHYILLTAGENGITHKLYPLPGR